MKMGKILNEYLWNLEWMNSAWMNKQSLNFETNGSPLWNLLTNGHPTTIAQSMAYLVMSLAKQKHFDHMAMEFDWSLTPMIMQLWASPTPMIMQLWTSPSPTPPVWSVCVAESQDWLIGLSKRGVSMEAPLELPVTSVVASFLDFPYNEHLSWGNLVNN